MDCRSREKTIKVMTLGEAGFDSAGVYGKQEALRSLLFAGLSISLLEVF